MRQGMFPGQEEAIREQIQRNREERERLGRKASRLTIIAASLATLLPVVGITSYAFGRSYAADERAELQERLSTLPDTGPWSGSTRDFYARPESDQERPYKESQHK